MHGQLLAAGWQLPLLGTVCSAAQAPETLAHLIDRVQAVRQVPERGGSCGLPLQVWAGRIHGCFFSLSVNELRPG